MKKRMICRVLSLVLGAVILLSTCVSTMLSALGSAATVLEISSVSTSCVEGTTYDYAVITMAFQDAYPDVGNQIQNNATYKTMIRSKILINGAAMTTEKNSDYYGYQVAIKDGYLSLVASKNDQTMNVATANGFSIEIAEGFEFVDVNSDIRYQITPCKWVYNAKTKSWGADNTPPGNKNISVELVSSTNTKTSTIVSMKIDSMVNIGVHLQNPVKATYGYDGYAAIRQLILVNGKKIGDSASSAECWEYQIHLKDGYLSIYSDQSDSVAKLQQDGATVEIAEGLTVHDAQNTVYTIESGKWKYNSSTQKWNVDTNSEQEEGPGASDKTIISVKSITSNISASYVMIVAQIDNYANIGEHIQNAKTASYGYNGYATVREKILINGSPIGNASTSAELWEYQVHLKDGYLSVYTDFASTITKLQQDGTVFEIAEGLIVEDAAGKQYVIQPGKWKYNKAANQWAVFQETEEDDNNQISVQTVQTVQSSTSATLKLTVDKAVNIGLQLQNAPTASYGYDGYADIREKILVNGNPIGNGDSSADMWEYQVHIMEGMISIYTDFPGTIAKLKQNNTILTIAAGLVLHDAKGKNYAILPGKWKYNSESNQWNEYDGSDVEEVSEIKVESVASSSGDSFISVALKLNSLAEVGIQLQNPKNASYGYDGYQAIRDKLLVNGKKIADSAVAADDWVYQIHLKDGYLTFYSDFAESISKLTEDGAVIEIASGLTVRDVRNMEIPVQSGKWKYNKTTGQWSAFDGEYVEPPLPKNQTVSVKSATAFAVDSFVSVTINLDSKIVPLSQVQMAGGTPQDTVLSNLYIDGKSIGEWVDENGGDLYTVMVHYTEFKQILLYFDMSREPDMSLNKVHTIEIQNNLVDLNNNKISPVKLYYAPEAETWSVVADYNGLEMPSSDDRNRSANYVKTSQENNCGLITTADENFRVVTLIFDKKVGVIGQAQTQNNAMGESIRKHIYIDGRSIENWIDFHGGNTYAIMTNYSSRSISFVFDLSREPVMKPDAVHTIEFKAGVLDCDKMKINPFKLYYNGIDGQWRIVDTFDGLAKPILSDKPEAEVVTSGTIHFTGLGKDEKGETIRYNQERTFRYITLEFDQKMNSSTNSQSLMDNYGNSVRENILIDGVPIVDWISKRGGDEYAVMVHTYMNTISFWFDVTREPSLVSDEVHTIEFAKGMVDVLGTPFEPFKLYYDRKNGWREVSSFDGLTKPENWPKESELAYIEETDGKCSDIQQVQKQDNQQSPQVNKQKSNFIDNLKIIHFSSWQKICSSISAVVIVLSAGYLLILNRKKLFSNKE